MGSVGGAVRIEGTVEMSLATDKGVDNRARHLKYPWGPLS
jgi:hypothetical protein